MRFALFVAVVATAGCDTFRALDSVQVPGSDLADVGSVDMPAELDADVGGDMPRPDLGDDGPMDMPPADMSPLDMPPDLDFDRSDLPDDGGPLTCPDVNPRAPDFTTSESHVLIEEDLGDADEVVSEEVSIAAGEPGQGQAVFVTAHRALRGTMPESILTAFPIDGVTSELLLTHAVAQPFSDVAVARAPSAGEFAFVASAETPGCVGTGIQAISGRVGVGGGISQVGLAAINDDCGTAVPRVALTGADGVDPNLRIVSTSLINGDVRAYPWNDATPLGATDGSQFVDHVSASTRDAVVTPTETLDQWWFWRPALADSPVRVDLGGNGDLEVEHLYDGCYAVATPSGTNVVVAPVACDTDCAVQPANSFSLNETVQRADIAPLAGGGFVLVTAIGEGPQRIEARFFDDAYQPRMVDGETVIEMVAPGPRIGDFAVATTRDAEGIFVGVVYSAIGVSDRKVGLSVLRLSLPDP